MAKAYHFAEYEYDGALLALDPIASYVAYDLLTSPWPWTATLKHLIAAPNGDMTRLSVWRPR